MAAAPFSSQGGSRQKVGDQSRLEQEEEAEACAALLGVTGDLSKSPVTDVGDGEVCGEKLGAEVDGEVCQVLSKSQRTRRRRKRAKEKFDRSNEENEESKDEKRKEDVVDVEKKGHDEGSCDVGKIGKVVNDEKAPSDEIGTEEKLGDKASELCDEMRKLENQLSKLTKKGEEMIQLCIKKEEEDGDPGDVLDEMYEVLEALEDD